jgi:hypothetical protein
VGSEAVKKTAQLTMDQTSQVPAVVAPAKVLLVTLVVVATVDLEEQESLIV